MPENNQDIFTLVFVIRGIVSFFRFKLKKHRTIYNTDKVIGFGFIAHR